VKYRIGCGHRRATLMWNKEVMNFEVEILLRRVDCNIPNLINRKILIKREFWSQIGILPFNRNEEV
jgi:hypothetical protein